MSGPKIARTDWAELQVEELLSVPLVSEFVFRSPKHNDPTEKEVIDHLIVHKQQGVLISQKAQDDPEKRNPIRNEQWVLKNIRRALKPICGAINNPDDRPKWCEHPRLGRVEFAVLPPIIHGIALVETLHPIDLCSIASDLPLEYLGVPITYMSINDFLNLVVRLRTVPELLEYLDARRTLPVVCLRTVGDEMCLFKLYLLKGGNLNGCIGYSDAKRAINTHADLVQQALGRNAEYVFYSKLMERVADCLATRDPNYTQGLSDHMRTLFDPNEKRKNYIILQEILTDLRLRERAELGRGLYTVTERIVGQTEGIKFLAAHIDRRDWVFLFAASRNYEKSMQFEAIHTLSRGALAHYQKSNCMIIVDRDGKHYDVALTSPSYQPTAEDKAVGEKHFGHLRMSTVDIIRL